LKNRQIPAPLDNSGKTVYQADMKDREYSPYQRKIINNYYKNREGLSLQKLQDLVAELYLAETDKKRDQLWRRVDKAIAHLEISPRLKEHILSSRNPEILAQNLENWWAAPPKERKPPKK
jgi:hypothetical protein